MAGFKNAAEWTAWAKSVETGSPVVTSYQLQPIARLVRTMYPSAAKWFGVNESVYAYAGRNNFTFSPAELVKVQTDWCDCEVVQYGSCDGSLPAWPGGSPWPCTSDQYDSGVNAVTCKPGKFLAKKHSPNYHDAFDGAFEEALCCRPCFTASG